MGIFGFDGSMAWPWNQLISDDQPKKKNKKSNSNSVNEKSKPQFHIPKQNIYKVL